ncbi:MAG: hypothetical protein ABI818_19065 [Acidobacteriota bacterium]
MKKSAEHSNIPFGWVPAAIGRQWRRAAVVVLALGLAFMVARAAANVWIGYQLRAEVARLERIYGSLDPASSSPRWQASPGSPGRKVDTASRDNRAVAVRAAASLTVVDTKDWTTVTRYQRPGSQPAASMPDVRRILDENRLAVQVAEQSRFRPAVDWEIDYAHDTNLPRLLDIRKLGAILSLECRVALDAGDGEERAVVAALTGLGVAESLHDEPVTILQLIRIGVAIDQFACVRDLLARGQPSGEALSLLARALAENRAPDAIRTSAIAEMKQMHRTLSEAAETNGPSPLDGTSWSWPVRWLGRPVIQYAHLRYLRGVTATIASASLPATGGPSPDAAAAPRAALRWWDVGRRIDAVVNRGSDSDARGAWRRVVDVGREYAAVLAAAELSVALRRARLASGSYPASLAELVPRFLNEVPADPFTGEPPRYSRQGAGVTVRVRGGPVTTAATPLLVWTSPR